ncbi:hypothetical protein [Nostoc sp. 'Peltigera membranacea cyanobiont' N6]|uniref:hypothetical protein n=1 Tax=Nostoc sp. 'Peltigera membranacea cyanobiont' N6 TaxID=1261031 RepID=UPI000CF3055B|nr:hypothetical protein [Nostoc sp. 'Peltigera membranacea cyanobiont' N6]AVH62410.1 hypothetical protein NPM_0539 [Nostoc sp. 'Peltigera membranacea cyanobiont' N6]
MPSQGTGANVDPRSLKPSIDLATVIELLAQAISPSSNQANPNQLNPRGMQLFEFDEKQNKRLRISTSAVMYRLFAQPKFKEAFKPAPGGGFIQDLSMPAYGNKSRVGGCLSDGNATKLPGAIDRLMAAIDQALNTAVPSDNLLSTLLLDDTEQQLKHLAKKAGTSFQNIANTANLVHLAFQAGDTKDNKSVATVICARERVENTDYFEQMCSAATEYLENELDNDEDDVNSSIATLKEEKNRYDSQIQRFLNFIDDEALSRVRLTISFRIMEAIAENARSSNDPDYQLLVEYVNRILILVESAKEEGYTVDLMTHFGSAAEFDLADELSKATFYYCLAVWPEWKTQIFEQKTKNQVEREVSYRFRVNGQNPELGKPAFEVRLDQIREYLLSNDESSLQKPWEICRRLAQLIFLAVVVPKKDEEPLTKESLTDMVNQLLANFKSQGTEAIRQTLEELQERSESMKSIAKALKEVLRDKNQKVMSQVKDRSSQQFICVKNSIMNWDRLEGAVTKLLVERQENSSEKVEWFKHIEICEQPATSGLLFSVKVTADLSEYDLKTKDTLSQLRAKRLLPQKLLQVCWVPRSWHWHKEDRQWTYELSTNASQFAGWALSAAIIVEYDVETVRRRANTRESEENKQYHAAAVTAFAVLVYCCLWRIITRLQKRGQKEKSVDFTTLMLRLQETGKQLDEEDKDKNGDAYVYAAAQTLEAILGEDTPIRMQGLILDNLVKKSKKDQDFIKSGTFKAFLSAFPLCISSPDSYSAPKIGLISYASRPCNEGNFPNDEEKAYLFLTQSYIATAVNEPFIGYELKRERMQSDVLDSLEQLKTQRLVQEEIRHLKAQGCQHIILLAHAYGDRRINRAANYNSSLRDTEFLEEVSQTFPDINIYPMVRDVFPATRLRDRGYSEAAFEILQAGDHSDFQRSVRTDDSRDFIPVYTFATLYAIQAEERLQSGFCIYFLVSDGKVSNINWTERARQHLINPDSDSRIHPCLLAVLRGLHFIEAERGVQKGQLIPVLDPFSWISPNTVEEAGEVKVLHTRRKGQVLLNYRAVLTHVSQVLHRK